MNYRSIILAAAAFPKNLLSEKKLFLVSEPASWAIYEDCRNIQKKLKGTLDAEIIYFPFWLKNKIIHFASENTFLTKNGFRDLRWFEKIHPSNKIVLTWFHISDEDTTRIHLIPLLNERVDIVHTASQNTKKKLIEYGLREDKIVVVPLGVDLELFHPAEDKKKESIRKELGIPNGKFVIGSFQKDGIGWGEGLEPKLIKGPDIFCDVVERLSSKYPLHILLTGPARGYVKNRLKKAHISYTHVFLKDHADISQYYQALDLYLITSREEGGPKALLESLASGIPIVSTNVGMVPEIIKDEKNGFMTSTEDIESILKKSEIQICNKGIRSEVIKNGIKTIQSYSSHDTVKAMYSQLYEPLLKQL